MPEYTEYMVLGYALSALTVGALVLSIWWRFRALAREEQLLQRLEQEAQQ